jgi:hypothetical protein
MSLLLLIASAAAPAFAAPGDSWGNRRHRDDPPEKSDSRSQQAATSDDSRSEHRRSRAQRSDRDEAYGGPATQAAETQSVRNWRRSGGDGISGKAQSSWRPRERHIRTIPDTSPVATQTELARDGTLRSTARRRDYRDGNYVRWSGSQWRGDSRYDWRRHRDRHRSLFRLGYYYDPFGWNYRRWHAGSYLYPGYYGSRFWLNDPWHYRLPPAYGPYRWVRYWNDALLVNIYTGEVVDVIRAFFW